MSFSDLPPIFQVLDNNPGSDPVKIFVSENDPTSASGFLPDQAVLNSVTGDLFQLHPTGWQKVANVRGPAGESGDGHLDPQELADLVDQLSDEFESDIDPVLLFENALL